MTEYLLTPPTVDEGFGQYERLTSPLWRYMQTEVAQSIVKLDGTWLVARIGSYPELSDLDAYYQGGSNYVVDQATRDDMVADGLGAYVVAIAPYSAVILEDSPEIYYRLGELAGPTAVDSSSNGRDGDLVPPGAPATGLIYGDVDGAWEGQASLVEDGTFTYIEGSPFASALTEFSIEVWVRSVLTDPIALLNIGDSGDLWINLGYPAPPDVFVTLVTNEDLGTTIFATATATDINDDNPHHLVATGNGSALRVYLDGAEIASAAYTGTLDVRYFRARHSQLIGTVIDEAAFYSTALSADRILAHYTAGVA